MISMLISSDYDFCHTVCNGALKACINSIRLEINESIEGESRRVLSIINTHTLLLVQKKDRYWKSKNIKRKGKKKGDKHVSNEKIIVNVALLYRAEDGREELNLCFLIV